jgi:hypothetical protein
LKLRQQLSLEGRVFRLLFGMTERQIGRGGLKRPIAQDGSADDVKCNIAQTLPGGDSVGQFKLIDANVTALGKYRMIAGELNCAPGCACVLGRAIRQAIDASPGERRRVPACYAPLHKQPVLVDRHDRTAVPRAHEPADALPRTVPELNQRVVSQALEDVRDEHLVA